MQTTALFVGIDVSQATLDVALRPRDEERPVAQTEEEIADLVAQLRDHHPTLIVLEATGGLEMPVLGALAAAGLPAWWP